MRLSARALDLELAALRVYISASAKRLRPYAFFYWECKRKLAALRFFLLRVQASACGLALFITCGLTLFYFWKREELAASCACGLMRVIASAMGLVRVRPRSIWVHPGAQPLVPGLQAKKRRALVPLGVCLGLLNLNYHTWDLISQFWIDHCLFN